MESTSIYHSRMNLFLSDGLRVEKYLDVVVHLIVAMEKYFIFNLDMRKYPVYKNENVQKVIINAVQWAKPCNKSDKISCTYQKEPFEK